MIVSTPQDIALIDARRGANMFRQVDVPVSILVHYFMVIHAQRPQQYTSS